MTKSYLYMYTFSTPLSPPTQLDLDIYTPK
jgi:hypothetical protein